MKKSILAIAVILGASTSFAQDLTSKKGESYLPEAGDYAISIDATPLLGYVQGIFGSNGGSSTGSWAFLNGNNTITGKYFVEDDLAYRLGLNIGFSSTTTRAFTASATTAGEQVIDERKTTASQVFLTGGLEWRKGSTRLQGFYGAELGLGFGGGNKNVYTYGNNYDFTTLPSQTHAVDGSVDIQETRQKGGVMIGLRGFVGAEYFILPKMAIGGEFGWGLGLATTGEGTSTAKVVNGAGTALEDQTTKTVAKGSAFSIGTDNLSQMFGPTGSLRISFHF